MKDMARNKRPKVFLDTNVLLDYQTGRSNEVGAMETIFEASLDNVLELCIAAHSLCNLFYIIRKDYSVKERRQIVLNYCALCTVISVDSERIEKAIKNNYSDDLEDALQIQCSLDGKCDYMLSRDAELLAQTHIRTMLPHEVLSELGI